MCTCRMAHKEDVEREGLSVCVCVCVCVRPRARALLAPNALHLVTCSPHIFHSASSRVLTAHLRVECGGLGWAHVA